MSTRPTVIPTWSTDETNQDTPSGGQIATGWTPGQTGVSDYDNWFKNWAGKWLTWMQEDKILSIYPSGGFFGGSGGVFGAYGAGLGTQTLFVGLPMVEGSKIKRIEFARYGDASADLVATLNRLPSTGTAVPVAALTVTNPAAAWTDSVINLQADTGAGALTINLDATSPGSVTRTTGSFITDGFAPGMTVTISGYVNAGNNTTKVIAPAGVSATVLTFTSNSGLVTEAGTGNERVLTDSTALQAAGDLYQMQFVPSATNISIGAIRITYAPG